MTVRALDLASSQRARARPLVWWITYTAPLVTAAVAFIWILNTQLLRLYSVSAPSWDLGQTQQLLWSLAYGYGWTSSFEYGHNFLGIHLEPILLPIAAVERIWPSPVVPLVFAAAGLAATAPAAFLMFRALLHDHRGAAWLAAALAIPMPFWAATQQAASSQFHPENLALALAMLALWAGLRAKAWLLWTLAVLVLCCKEDQTYTAFVIGLVIWRAGPQPMRPHGRRVMILAAAWLVVGVGMFQELIRGTGYSPDVAYYWWIFNPAEQNFFLQNVARPDPWLVLSGLLLSIAGLPLLAPRWLLLVVPPLIANLMSSHDAQGRLPPAFGADDWLFTRTPAADRLLASTSVIPPDAPVYADDGAAVWLADRPLIQVLPSQLPSDRYIVIDRQDWKHGLQANVARADEIALLSGSGRKLLVDDGRFQVWSP